MGGLLVRTHPAQAERLRGAVVLTAPTEVTDRVLIPGERRLRVVMAEHAARYDGRRHRAARPTPGRAAAL